MNKYPTKNPLVAKRFALVAFFGLLLLVNGTLGANKNSKPPSGPPSNKPNCTTNNGCVNFMAQFPILPFEGSLGSGALKIKRDDPTPALFTPAGLDHTARVLSFVNKVAAPSEAGDSYVVELTNERVDGVQFVREDGQTTGEVEGIYQGQSDGVVFLDANKDVTDSEPSFFRHYQGDGSYLDYPAQRGRLPVAMRTEGGRVGELATGPDEAYDVVLKQGAFRQIRSVAGLVDIVVIDEYGYEIRFYTPDNVGAKTGGEYQLDGEPYRVVEVLNPTGDVNNNETIQIIDTHGSYVEVHQWHYVPGADDWAYSRGLDSATGKFQLTEQKFVSTDSGTDDSIITTELRDENGEIVSRKRITERLFEWGRGQYISEIEDFGGFNLETTTEYYTNESESGRYGNEKSVVMPDGSWEYFDYDADSRLAQKVESLRQHESADTDQASQFADLKDQVARLETELSVKDGLLARLAPGASSR